MSESGYRFNMLAAFAYFFCFSTGIENDPGNVVIKNCEVENTKWLVHYNFGHEYWQSNRPMTDITLKNVTAKNIKLPITMCGSEKMPVRCRIIDSDIVFAEDRTVKNADTQIDYCEEEFMKADNFEEIILDNVNITGVTEKTLIKSWTEKGGKVICKDLHCNNFSGEIRVNTDEKYECEGV